MGPALKLIWLSIVAACVLAPVSAAQDLLAEPERLYGAYATDGDGTFTVTRLPDHMGVRFDHIESGLMSRLSPAPDNAANLVATRQGQPLSDALRVRFPETDALLVTAPDGNTRAGRRVAAHVEDVSFLSGQLSQHGVLVTPATSGPHPAVIFLAGDGPSIVENFLPWAYYFAAHGYAALAVDKRGYGRSEGNGESALISDNAQDAVAALDYLATRQDIDARQLGLLGSSRGGWTAPMAAQLSGRVAFMIISSGGPVSVRDQERHARLLRIANPTDETQALAASVLDDYFQYLASGGAERVAQVSANWTRYHQEPWYAAIRVGTGDPTAAPWPAWRVQFADDIRMDARALYERTDVPTLFLFGAADELFPATQAVDAVREMGAAKRDWSVQIFEGASHSFNVAAPGEPMRIAPGYFNAMFEWLGTRVPLRSERR